MRITKTMAKDVAEILTSKFDIETQKIENQLSQWLTEVFEKKVKEEEVIPKDVMEFFEKIKNDSEKLRYLPTTTFVYVKDKENNYALGNKSYSGYRLLKTYPCNYSSHNLYLYLEDIELKEFKAIELKIENRKKEGKKLKQDTENTIFSCRTFNRLLQEFPEAAKHIKQPVKINEQVAIKNSIEQLKQKLCLT